MRMRSLFGSASSYAHLAGLVPLRGSHRAEDEDDKDTRRGKRSKAEDDDGDEDEPKGRRSRAEDDDRDDEPKGKRSRAEDEDDDTGARAEDDDDNAEDDEDEPKSRKSKRAKAEDEEDDTDAEDDDDKEEMSGKSAAARARRRERARCQAIFSHKAAAQNVALAASLAFDTTMTRKEAIAVLKGQEGRGGAPRADRDDRRRRNPDLGPSDDGGGASNARNAKAGWDAALAKVGVKAR